AGRSRVGRRQGTICADLGDQGLASPSSNSTSSSLRPSTRPLTWWISHPTLAFPFWSDLMVIWITPLPAAPLTLTFLLSDLPLIFSTSAGLILYVTTIDSPASTFTTLGSLSGAYSRFLPSTFLSSAVTTVTANARTAELNRTRIRNSCCGAATIPSAAEQPLFGFRRW